MECEALGGEVEQVWGADAWKPFKGYVGLLHASPCALCPVVMLGMFSVISLHRGS